jgi:Xaa-Pro aminopeptidase
LIVTADRAIIGTDFRYWERATQEAPAFELFKFEGKPAERMAAFIKEAAVTSLGVEGQQMTLAEFEALQKLDGISIEWKQLNETVESLRHLKSAEEIEAIRAAAAITDQAMSSVNEIARPGMSEKQLAWELEKIMREAGADAMAFSVIIASGPNGAMAHHSSSGRKLQEGDAIVVDMGAKLNGYNSDLTRTFHLGSRPDEKFWQIYNLVHKAQTAALEGIRAGQKGKAMDALAREVIEAADFGKEFGHSLGHGVGLEVHEGPRLSFLADDDEEPLPAGAVVTVEPGVYLPGWGGVRIEDLVLVTDSGVELLSRCSKNPIIPV